MIETKGRITYSVQMQNEQGVAYPEVRKNGVTYVIAKPGETFQVRAARDTDSPSTGLKYSVDICIDGESVGAWKRLTDDSASRMYCTVRGWRIDHLYKRAFVFGQPRQLESGVTGRQPLRAAAQKSPVGSLVVSFWKKENYKCPVLRREACSECAFRGFEEGMEARTAKEPASVVQADGKKFYNAPSLTAGSGRVLTSEAPEREVYHWRKKNKKPEFQMKLCFETAPILMLRKVLDSKNPEHVKLLEGGAFGWSQVASTEPVAPGHETEDSKPKLVKVTKNEGSNSSGVAEAKLIRTEARKETKHARKRTLLPTIIETVDLMEDDGDDQDCLMYTVSKKPKLEAVVSVD